MEQKKRFRTKSWDGEAKKVKHEDVKYFKAFTMIYAIIIVISADLLHEFMNSLYDLVHG